MTRIIAIANHKGGVAKTTTAAALGAALSRKGRRVLVVDLDAQQNLTTAITSENDFSQIGTTYEVLKGQTGGKMPAFKISENLFLTPARSELVRIEQELAGDVEADFHLLDCMDSAKKEFDYILLDCPPNLGEVTINAFVAATEVFIPLTAEALPTKGLVNLIDFIYRVQRRFNKGLQLSGILLTRFNGRKLNKTVEESTRAKFGPIVFATRIRENISLAEAPLANMDIFRYAPESNGAIDYLNLADEVISQES